MMDDSVSRKAVVKIVDEIDTFVGGWRDYAIEQINQLPSAERKTGRWIHDGRDNPHGIDWCHCSVCGNRDSVDSVYTHVDVYPYCARCGARMVDEVTE